MSAFDGKFDDDVEYFVEDLINFFLPSEEVFNSIKDKIKNEKELDSDEKLVLNKMIFFYRTIKLRGEKI